MKKCHNCKGTGIVRGGFNKRVEREILAVENERDRKIVNVSEKDSKKKKSIINEIENVYEKISDKISKQTPKLVSNCLYCSSGDMI